MPPPLLSVIINTYNYGHFIEETIHSTLAQDFPADQMEILVVDDGSTHDTANQERDIEELSSAPSSRIWLQTSAENRDGFTHEH